MESVKINSRDHLKPKQTHYLPSIELEKLFPIKQEVVLEENKDRVRKAYRPKKSNSSIIWLWVLGVMSIMVIFGWYWTFYSKVPQDLSDVLQYSEATVADTSKTTNETMEVSKIESADLIDGCVVITGTFSNDHYAKDMLYKISNKGYNTFESQHNGLLRVGLRIDCQNLNLDSLLFALKSEFSERVWFLVPDYNPEI